LNAQKARSPEELYRLVAERLGVAPDAPGARGFGSSALKTNGKIFASLSKGRLLVKLPRDEAEALVAVGRAEPFSTGGKAKKEWVTLGPSNEAEWVRLAEEARRYVERGSP
jgi:hypothetical protein